MTAINQWCEDEESTFGMKSTSVHFLPVELLAFLDIAPYLFTNREEDPHTFWTSTAALLTFRHVTEVSLTFRDIETLTEILELLKTKSSREVLWHVLDSQAIDEDLVDIDHEYLKSSHFRVENSKLKKEDESLFNKVLCCLTFHLRYKLVDFEEDDRFIKRAEVIFQEPPCMVYQSIENKWNAKYLESIDYLILEDENGTRFHANTTGPSTPKNPSPWNTPPASVRDGENATFPPPTPRKRKRYEREGISKATLQKAPKFELEEEEEEEEKCGPIKYG